MNGYAWSEHYVTSKIFENLFEWDPWNKKYKLILIDELKASPDNKVFTLRLKKGIKFHDGHEFNADDILFFYNSVKNKAFDKVIYSDLFNHFYKAEALSEYKVKFYATKVSWRNLDILSNILAVPSHYYKNTEVNMHQRLPLGTGPYKVSKVDKTQMQVSLIENKDWWGRSLKKFKDLNNFKNIKFKVIKDKSLAFNMLERDKIHFLRDLPSFVKDEQDNGVIKKNKNVYVKKKTIVNKFYRFKWNFKNSLFQDINIRKALSLLIDKSNINNKFYNSSKTVITRPFFQNTAWTKTYKDLSYGYNPKVARELLAKSGWSDEDKDGLLEKNGSKLSFTVSYTDRNDEKVLSFLQEEYLKSGIRVELSHVESSVLYKLVTEKNFDALYGASVVSESTPGWAWRTTGVFNYQSYSNPDLDNIFKKMDLAVKKTTTLELLKNVEKALEDDFAMTMLFAESSYRFGVSKMIKVNEYDDQYLVNFESWKFK